MANRLNTAPKSPHSTPDEGGPDRPLERSLLLYPRAFDPTHEMIKSEERLSAGLVRLIPQLPDELFICIFSYVLRMKPHPIGPSFRSYAEWYKFMGCPILFTHICSSWRRIVIHSSTLWCRICIYPELFNHPKLVALLETYLHRVGQNLLDLFILGSPQPRSPYSVVDHASEPFLAFLRTTVPRAKCLIIKGAGGLFSGGHPRSTLVNCLDQCVPGTLEELTVNVATYDDPVSHMPNMSLGLPRHKFEELWRSVPILRLNGYYPYAINTSNLSANHGFTELRLKGWHPITEITLVDILTASPRLRVLEVSMDILGSLSKGPLIEPIHLEHLETVKSGIGNRPLTHQRQLRILLRLLQPGSKPLSLCISNPNQGSSVEFACQPEVRAFLARSNVRNLCVHELERRSHLVELVKLVPSLRALAIPALRTLRPDVNVLPTQTSIDALYVIPSFLSFRPGSDPSPSADWPTVKWLAETYKFRELTVWMQDFEFGYPSGMYSRKPFIPENLYTICPLVSVMTREGLSPAQDWC